MVRCPSRIPLWLVFSAQCLLVAAAFLGVILVLSTQHSAAYTDAVLEQIYLRQVNANASILTPMLLRESAIHRLGAKVNHEVHNPTNANRLQASGYAVSDRMTLSSMRPFFNDAFLLVDGDPLLKMVAQMQYSNNTKSGGVALSTTPVTDRHLNLASIKNELTLSSLYAAIVRNALGEMILQPSYPVVMAEDGGYIIRLPYDPSEEPAIKNNNLDSLTPAWRGPYAIFDPVTAGVNAPAILSAFFIYPIQMFAPPWQHMVEHAVVCQMDLSYLTELAAQAALSPATTALIFSTQHASEIGDGGGGHFYASSHPHVIPPYNEANRTTWTALDLPIVKYRNQYLEARRRCLSSSSSAHLSTQPPAGDNDDVNNSSSSSPPKSQFGSPYQLIEGPNGDECDYVIFEYNNANGASSGELGGSAGSIFRLNGGDLDIVSLIVMATTSGIQCNLLQTTPRSFFFADSERSAAVGIGIGAAGALIVIIACIAILIAIRSQLRVLMRAMRLAADMRNDEAAAKSHERSATLSEMRALQLTFEQMNQRLLLARPFLPQSLLVVQSLIGAEDSFSSGTHDYDHLDGAMMSGGGEGQGGMHMMGAEDLAVSIAASLARRTSQLGSVGGFLSGGDAYSRSIFDEDDEAGSRRRGDVNDDEDDDTADGLGSDYETLYWRQLRRQREKGNSPKNEANADVDNGRLLGGVGQGGFELDPLVSALHQQQSHPSAVPFHRSSVIHSDRDDSRSNGTPRHHRERREATTNSSEGELDLNLGPSSCSPIVGVLPRSAGGGAAGDASTSASNSREEDNTGSSSGNNNNNSNQPQPHRSRSRGNNNSNNIRSADAPSSPVALSLVVGGGPHPAPIAVGNSSASHPSVNNNAANSASGGGNRKVGFHHHSIVASSSLTNRGSNGNAAGQQQPSKRVVVGGGGSSSPGGALASSPQFTHLASVHSKSLMRTVGVLCVNLRNFHRLSGGGGGLAMMNAPAMPTNSSVDYLQRIHSLICAIVESAANAERGIVDSFQGDHFIVSFNAARPVASIAQSAATVAMRIADEGERIETVLGRHHPFTMGLATGRALVGNMGTDTMKRLCTVGRVVPEAVRLERMCRRVGQACLATERTCADLEGVVRTIVVGRAKLFDGNNNANAANGNNKYGHQQVGGVESPNFHHTHFHRPQHQQTTACGTVSGGGRGVVGDPQQYSNPQLSPPPQRPVAGATAAPPAFSPPANSLSPDNAPNRPHHDPQIANDDAGAAVCPDAAMLEALHPDLLVKPLQEKQPRQQQQQQHIENSNKAAPPDAPPPPPPPRVAPPPLQLPFIHALAHVITRSADANDEWMYELKQQGVDDPFQHYNDTMTGLLMLGGAMGEEERMEECRAMLAESLQRCASTSDDSSSAIISSSFPLFKVEESVNSDPVVDEQQQQPKPATAKPAATVMPMTLSAAPSPFGCDDGAADLSCQQQQQQLPGSVEPSSAEQPQQQQREEIGEGRKSSGVMLSLVPNDNNSNAVAADSSMSSSMKHVAVGGAALVGFAGAARRKVSFPQTPLHNWVMMGGNHSNANRSFEAQGVSVTPSYFASSPGPTFSIPHNHHHHHHVDRFPELDPFHLPKPRSVEWARQRLLRAMYLCCSAPRSHSTLNINHHHHNNYHHQPQSASSLGGTALLSAVPPHNTNHHHHHHHQPIFPHVELAHTENKNDDVAAPAGGEEGSPAAEPHLVVYVENVGSVAQLLCYNMKQ